MPVSAATFQQLALEDPEGHWELWHGDARKKPGMTADHNFIATYLAGQLLSQLDVARFEVRSNAAHVRYTEENYFIPDVSVLPAEAVRPFRGRDDVLEAYDMPLPLVVEVWSRSTGGYDQRVKIAEYQRRGDREIWLIHPYARTLTRWLRRPDGTYEEHTQTGGTVEPAFLPGVRIDLDRLLR